MGNLISDFFNVSNVKVHPEPDSKSNPTEVIRTQVSRADSNTSTIAVTDGKRKRKRTPKRTPKKKRSGKK